MENDNFNSNDQSEKKPKRPRIGAQPAAEASGSHARYDSFRRPAPEHDNHDFNAPERATYPRRAPYQPREDEGGYQPRYNRYNNQGDGSGSYPRRSNNYQQYPRRNYDFHARQAEGAEGTERTAADGEQTGYQQRRTPSYPRQGNYQPRYNNQGPRQGGYNNRYNQGNRDGYGQNRYNQGNRYNQHRPATDGTDAENQASTEQNGYQPRYNNQGHRPGGYNNRYNQGNRDGYGQNRGNRYNQGNRRPGGNQGGAFPTRGKSFVPRPKRIEYEQPVPDPNEEIRLNKYMSNAGICSRREADEFIQQGLVKVNGQVVTELGTKITAKDVVEYDDKVVTLESKCYILLNKPKDCVTTSDDPNGRLTVMDLVKGACNERIYPVGRLDRNTTGVLLLTNDGDLASKLTHPKFVKKKIYHVWCDKDIAEDDMQRIADGIELEDGPIHADAISYATETDRNQAGIEIHSGRNRIVRRIFESLGYHVTKLDRVYFAGLTKKNLPRGRWRYLTQEEVNYLKMGSFE